MNIIELNRIKRAKLFCKMIALVLAIVLISSLRFGGVLAAAGDLDTGFGNGGKVTTDYFGSDDQVLDVIIQPDGRIVTAGFTARSQFFEQVEFAITRYNTDGSLDTSFGVGGKVTTDFFGQNDVATAIVLQTDGRLIAGGATSDESFSNPNFALARYNTDGSLDTSFGTQGKVITDIGGDFDGISDLVIQPDGKIVAVGSATIIEPQPRGTDFALARYNSDGSLDTSFGVAGKVITDFFIGTDSGTGVALQSDGKIVVCGSVTFGTLDDDMAIVRYNGNGSLDNTFGNGGLAALTSVGGLDAAEDIAVQSDNKIVAAGRIQNQSGNHDFALIRCNPNGTFDSGFGNLGKVITPVNVNSSIGAMTIQSDGKIVAVGSTFVAFGPINFAVARYNTNGSLDNSFGNGGTTMTSFSNNRDIAQGVALQSDGKIVVCGRALTLSLSEDMALARYNAQGEPFDICLEGGGKLFQFNSVTGNYQFTICGSFTLTGTGIITRQGNTIKLTDNGRQHRVLVNVNTATDKGSASVQLLSQGVTHTITDKGIAGNICSCP